MTRAAAIVVNHGRSTLLAECLSSLQAAFAEAEGAAQIVVVDNASPDDSVAMVRERFPAVTLVELGANRGFAGGVNAGLERVDAEWVLLLNNDATLAPDALGRLLAETGAPDVGAVAAQMRFAGRRDVVNSAGLEIDVLGVAYDVGLGGPGHDTSQDAVDVFGTSAGAALYRTRMLDEVGGLDEDFFVYLEDADLAWRAAMAGWRTRYVPGALAWHHHAATAVHGSDFKYFHVGRNRVRMLARNATTRHLRRYGAAILVYDLAYVAYVAATDRTLAPLRGRVAGLREWRRWRAAGHGARRDVDLAPRAGLGAARRRRAAWRGPSQEAGR